MADESADKEPEKSPFIIKVVSFTKGFPFETRQGAFHSYTYLPFLGWLDPIALNLILCVLLLTLAVAIPAIHSRSRRTRGEKATAEGLAALRSAMSQSQKDTTWAPQPPEAMVRAGRLSAVPKADLLPYHEPSDAVLEAAEPDDQGGWRFDKASGDPARMVFVNCTHTDSRGTPWSSY
ncbi:MAG TPA: hypothetical protein DD417_14385 [Elusimicrobia bacterium]|nr:hypothetical protein [Elusimicrobiota bacterium]